MITPEEIRRKALNLYPAYLNSVLDGEAFFPREIPSRKALEDDVAAAGAAVRLLAGESKESIGFGYSVEWRDVLSKRFGRNRFPAKIRFDEDSDFLRFIGKQDEAAAFLRAVGKLRDRYPELIPWARSNKQLLVANAAEVDGLLTVVDWLRANPRPGLFARELPVGLDTKFIERNARVLGEWLDRVLPPDAVRADERHFERRYGLGYPELEVCVRFLSESAQSEAGSPWHRVSLPITTFATLPINPCDVIIVENKVNLLTLPRAPFALAIGGLGNAITDLQSVAWLGSCRLWYWGDIDVEGLEILARLRTFFPSLKSVMMNTATLNHWQALVTPGVGRRPKVPVGLSADEKELFDVCVRGNVRIEQEHLPSAWANDQLAAAVSST